MEVLDFGADERYRVIFENIPGHSVEQIIPNPAWTRFLVVYSVNDYGPYAPANQIAMYDLHDGYQWLIAGDDLPGVDGREGDHVSRPEGGWLGPGCIYHADGRLPD